MLSELFIKDEYRTFRDDITNEFLNPVLNLSIRYDRAVGYFSSTALLEVMKGISGLIKNNGKIRIIASPELTEDDLIAIHEGYKVKEDIIHTQLVSKFKREFTFFEKRRLNLLMNLIANNYLEIKIAMIDTHKGLGIYHEKMGILEDKEGNKIAFTGSLNETKSAFLHNYESIDIYKSWIDSERNRVNSKSDAFERIWRNSEIGINTFSISEDTLNFLMQFKVDDVLELDIDEQESRDSSTLILEEITEYEYFPKYPANIHIREYQREAIDNWLNNDAKGIFLMATGTGKTITGLAAVTELSNKLNHELVIVIVCPYQHLVIQWVEDIRKFNLNPIIGFSTSPQKKWKINLKDEVRYINAGISKHLCFVTTNATFSSQYVQEQLAKIKSDIVLVVDEAHNFGAEYLKTKLPSYIKYRLALSATINRHGDKEGTESLYQYFGSECINYTLEMAIENKMLTPYKYFPIVVTLTEEELEQYKELSKKISKLIKKNKFGKIELTNLAKMLLIQRAQIVAGAENKIKALMREIAPYRNDNNILIYCGATSVNDPDYEKGLTDNEEIRQIDLVTKYLGDDLNMRVAQFTSNETTQEREQIISAFETKHIQALIAIKCLDEGVNIPSIDKAFILASSTNPKEYIQRRGRVLRTFKDKYESVIYDFITLPIDFSEIDGLSIQEIKSLKSLAKREIERMLDFAKLAKNGAHTFEIIEEIKEAYRFYYDDEETIDNEFD